MIKYEILNAMVIFLYRHVADILGEEGKKKTTTVNAFPIPT